MEKWSTTFAGRCQWLNIARVQEGKGDLKAAVEAYQAQVKGFPDSGWPEREEALERLKKAIPNCSPRRRKKEKRRRKGRRRRAPRKEVTAPAPCGR